MKKQTEILVICGALLVFSSISAAEPAPVKDGKAAVNPGAKKELAVPAAYKADSPAWKNANFNSVMPDEKRHKYYQFNKKGTWKFEDDKHLVPREWDVQEGSVGMLKKVPGSKNDYYLQLEKGYLTQYYVSPAKGTIRVTFQARGKERFELWTCSYRNKTAAPGKPVNGYDILKKTETYHLYKLTPEWKQYTVDVKKAGVPTERVAIRFYATDKGKTVLDIDDVYVYPIPDAPAKAAK